MVTIAQAKARLDLIIAKGRVDLYKPIQIAEVLHHSRLEGGIERFPVKCMAKRDILTE